MGVSEKWDLSTKSEAGSIRGRMLADEELSEEDFERLAYRIALEAHEDRLKLWETALIRYETINRLEGEVEHLQSLVKQWMGNCTGMHGSQKPCGLGLEDFTSDAAEKHGQT